MPMTLEEALLYVFKILNDYWKETHIDDLGRLLSELNPSYIPGTNRIDTGDPAAWYDWADAVRKVKPDEPIADEEAIKARIATSDPIAATAIYPNAWDDWVEAVRKTLPNGRITEEEAIKAIIELMKQYNNEGFDLNEVINHFGK
jgi:hypothetical protein